MEKTPTSSTPQTPKKPNPKALKSYQNTLSAQKTPLSQAGEHKEEILQKQRA